jgi:hypothetical protein
MATADELAQARISESEAKTETKIARLEGKLDLVLANISAVDKRLSDVRGDIRSTRSNIWAVGIAIATLIVAIVVLFPVFFDIGAKSRLRDFEQGDGWSFCLMAGTLCPANQEKS